MFNLEQKISEWRKQMLAAGIKTPVPLEELENHLREEIERQMKSGLREQNALEISVQKIGEPKILKNEFKKSERTFMKRILIIGAGVVGILIGMAFVMPAVAQYRQVGAMTSTEVCLFLLGMVLTLGGITTAVFNFRKRKV